MPSLPELLALPYGQSNGSAPPLSLAELSVLPYDGSSPFSQGLTSDDFRVLVRQYGERVIWLRAVKDESGTGGAASTRSGKKFVQVVLSDTLRVFLSQNRRDPASQEFALTPIGETTISFLPDEFDPVRDDRFIALDRAFTERYFFTPSGQSFDTLPHKNIAAIQSVISGNQTLSPTSYTPSSQGINWRGTPPKNAVTVVYSYHPHFEWLGESSRQAPLGTDAKRLPCTGPLRLLSAREE